MREWRGEVNQRGANQTLSAAASVGRPILIRQEAALPLRPGNDVNPVCCAANRPRSYQFFVEGSMPAGPGRPTHLARHDFRLFGVLAFFLMHLLSQI